MGTVIDSTAKSLVIHFFLPRLDEEGSHCLIAPACMCMVGFSNEANRNIPDGVLSTNI